MTKYLLPVLLCLFVSFGNLISQEIEYNDNINDEELSKKEMEYQKKQMENLGVADPFYEEKLKNSWSRDKEEKVKEAVEELKKDYKTNNFTKEVLEKDPNDLKKDSPPSILQTPVADPYYEEEIKGSWNKETQEIKKEVLERIEEKVTGEKKEKDDSKEREYLYSDDYSEDGRYREEIKKEDEKIKEKLIDGSVKKMVKDGAIETKEQREKRLKEEEEKKREKQNQQIQPNQ